MSAVSGWAHLAGAAFGHCRKTNFVFWHEFAGAMRAVLNEIRGECCFAATIALLQPAFRLEPLALFPVTRWFSANGLDLNRPRSLDWAEFFCAIVAKSSGPQGFDKARSGLIALEARQ